MKRLLEIFRKSLNMKITAISILSVLLGLWVLILVTQYNMKSLTELSLKTMQGEMDVLVHEYYDHYISEISMNMEESMSNTMKENQIITAILQTLFDHEGEFTTLDQAIETIPYFEDKINETGKWYQNNPNEPTVVFIPGISIDENGIILKDVAKLVRQTAILDLIMPSFYQQGVHKLQVYYQGGEDKDMFRLAPWSDIGKNIFDVYPELNDLPIWETFNPGLVQDMYDKMAYLKSNKLPVTGLSKASPPVQDGLTGEIVITFGTPVWSHDYTVFEGSLGYDVPITDIIERVEKIKLSESGFAFLSQSNGNVFAVNEVGAEKLGIKSIQSGTEDADTGFNRLKRFVQDSKYASVQSIDLSRTEIAFADVSIDGSDYVIITKPVKAYQTWSTENGFYDEYWTLGFVVSKEELYKGYLNIGHQMGKVLDKTLFNQLIISSLIILLLIVAIALFNSRLTKQLNKLAASASAIGDGDYNLVVDINSQDEIGVLTKALNQMSGEIRQSFTLLQTSEEKYRSLIENVENMIFSVTADGNFIALNNSFERLLDKDRSEIIGKKMRDILKTDEEALHWETLIESVLKTKVKLTTHTTLDVVNGSKLYLSVTLIPLVDELGVVTMILGSITDISDLVQAQEEIAHLHDIERNTLEEKIAEKSIELEQTRVELIEKEKLASLGSLVTGVAHELNTPLGTAVSAGSYIEYITKGLTKKIDDEALSKEDLFNFISDLNQSSTLINVSLKRAAELVGSFKNIAVNQSFEEKSIVDIKGYMDLIRMSLQHEISAHGYTIQITCDEGLVVETYPGAFLQIMTHLIANTMMHGHDGVTGGNRNIDIVFALVEQTLQIKYMDHGKGISPEYLSRIYEPFFTTNRGKGGTGLGLNIVYNLVNSKLNGKITCQSEMGKGTTFLIQLPLTETED